MAASSPLLPIQFLLLCSALHFTVLAASGTADGSEEWGYVQVRPRAHMFWWLYRSAQRTDAGPTPWPTVLWLQGGPGSSGVAMGNFEEIGPLDANLKPRKSTWLQKADLLFVDNPVGTGFSFVEDESLLVKSDVAAATDLTTLLKKLYNGNETWQKSPLFIVAESYGGKFAATVGLAIHNAITAGELMLKFGGVALGDSWISPEDFVFSWGPLLKDVSRLDEKSSTDWIGFLLCSVDVQRWIGQQQQVPSDCSPPAPTRSPVTGDKRAPKSQKPARDGDLASIY